MLNFSVYNFWKVRSKAFCASTDNAYAEMWSGCPKDKLSGVDGGYPYYSSESRFCSYSYSRREPDFKTETDTTCHCASSGDPKKFGM